MLAQVPSRAALLEAERRGKPVIEPKTTNVERGIKLFAGFSRFLSNYQSGLKGFHFAGGDFPSGAGLAYGVGFEDLALGAFYPDEDLSNRVDLNFVAATSTSDYHQLSGEVKWLNIAGSPLNTRFKGIYFEHPEEDFYGVGVDSAEDDRTSYKLKSSNVGGQLWLEPWRGLRLGAGGWYLKPKIGSG